MAGSIQGNENQRTKPKTTLCNKATTHNWRWNKDIHREKEAERVKNHQTSCARNAKGTIVRRKREGEVHRHKE